MSWGDRLAKSHRFAAIEFVAYELRRGPDCGRILLNAKLKHRSGLPVIASCKTSTCRPLNHV